MVQEVPVPYTSSLPIQRNKSSGRKESITADMAIETFVSRKKARVSNAIAKGVHAEAGSQVDLQITSPKPVYPIMVYPASGDIAGSAAPFVVADLSNLTNEVSAECSGQIEEVSRAHVDEVEVVIPYWQGALWADMNAMGDSRKLCVSAVRDVSVQEALEIDKDLVALTHHKVAAVIIELDDFTTPADKSITTIAIDAASEKNDVPSDWSRLLPQSTGGAITYS